MLWINAMIVMVMIVMTVMVMVMMVMVMVMAGGSEEDGPEEAAEEGAAVQRGGHHARLPPRKHCADVRQVKLICVNYWIYITNSYFGWLFVSQFK